MHYNTILLAIFAAGTVSVGASPHNNGRSNANNCIPLHLKCIPVDNKSDPLPPNETCCLNDVPGIDVSLAVVSIHSYVALQIAIHLFSHLSAMPRQGHVNWHKGKVASLNLGVVCSIFFKFNVIFIIYFHCRSSLIERWPLHHLNIYFVFVTIKKNHEEHITWSPHCRMNFISNWWTRRR